MNKEEKIENKIREFNDGYKCGKRESEEEFLKKMKLAKQCLNFQGFYCENKNCKNEDCPLHEDLK